MRRLLLACLASAVSLLAVPAVAADPSAIAFKSDSSGTLPPRVKSSGTVIRTISWSDGKGDNIAIFSATSTSKQKGDITFLTRSIFVDVFAGKDGKLKKVRTIKEVVSRCEYDISNDFLDTSVGVTDLDNNGIGELTFAYRTACRSDVSPADMKVLVLEGGKKYILRGLTSIPGEVENDFKPDFKGAPESFLAHATKVWAKFKVE